ERADDAAVGDKDDLNQILEAARDSFNARTIRLATEQRTCAAVRSRSVRPAKIVTIGIADGEIEPAIRAEGEAVETAVVAVTEAGEDDGPFVREAIALSVFQCDQVRWVGGVKLSATPGQTH